MYFINYKLKAGAKAPWKRSAQDAGYDLYAIKQQTLFPGSRAYIPVGVHIEMPNNIFAFLTNTSTAGARGVICLSHIVDAGYRGDIGPILFNLSQGNYYIKPGDKVAQIVLLPSLNTTLVKRVELGPGNREDKEFD